MTVTIVDDLAENLECYQDLLSEEFVVQAIQNPLDLLAQIKTLQTDLVLLDVHMPELHGLELYEKLRAEHPLTPVIFLTGDGSEETIVKALDLGVEDFIVKPVTSAELIARIKNKIQKSIERKSQTLKFENLTIYLDHQMVQVADQIIPLTPSEFKILCIFARKPNKTISREEILKSLSADTKSILSGNIDTHISNLRKKIAILKYKIKTIKSLGYILKQEQ